jgi:hypothetical protein
MFIHRVFHKRAKALPELARSHGLASLALPEHLHHLSKGGGKLLLPESTRLHGLAGLKERVGVSRFQEPLEAWNETKILNHSVGIASESHIDKSSLALVCCKGGLRFSHIAGARGWLYRRG